MALLLSKRKGRVALQLLRSHLMNQFTISLPIILYCYKILSQSSWTNQYLKEPCAYIKIDVPLTLLMSLLVIHIGGFECISHYQKYYLYCFSVINGNFSIFCATRLRTFLMIVPGSMITWKIFLLQRRLVYQHAPSLCDSKLGNILDVDGMSLVSYSKEREGSDFGHSKKFKGRPLLQLSGSFIGKIFIDCKLFPGNTNTAAFFKKAIKRSRSLGYVFHTVRADALYGISENLLFLDKLSLDYAIGIKTSLNAIKEGKKLFKKLARKKSYKIIHINKGIAIMSLGIINIAKAGEKNFLSHVILCRRIHRRKKNGKWKIKVYYHAIVTNLDMTPRAIYNFYMKRQVIENGFKELRYHYSINNFCKNGKESIKANELWIASKMFAMTMYKIFAETMISKQLRSKRRKTLLRDLFENTIFEVQKNKVLLHRNPKHLWHLKRILSKMEQNKFLNIPYIIRA